jgi:superfamily II DNA/RNA helicase
VSPALNAALAKLGITEPTPIQSAAIPLMLEGKPTCLRAETGTGKTLAYLLPIFTRLDLAETATQAIVLAPTHELAIQIHRQCTDLSQHAALPVRSLLLISGTALDRQIDKLKTRPHVVVGSPGRIRDLIHKARLRTAKVRTLVLDEADRLLTGDSAADIASVLKSLPVTRQVVFASATLQPASTGTMEDMAPGVILLEPGAQAVNADITHLYLVCERRDKLKLLRQVLSATRAERALVFAEDDDLAERAVSQLDHHHVRVAELHPDFDKRDRKQAMDEFRAGRVQVMVASDMAARGLDIPGVTHVINLDAPLQPRAYLHRAGRTGRAGRHGETITLLTQDQLRLVRRYESELGIQLQRVRLREGKVEAVGRDSS